MAVQESMDWRVFLHSSDDARHQETEERHKVEWLTPAAIAVTQNNLANWHSYVLSQFSIFSPGYAAKSRSLFVTRLTLSETAWAAINLSR